MYKEKDDDKILSNTFINPEFIPSSYNPLKHSFCLNFKHDDLGAWPKSHIEIQCILNNS